MKRDDFEREAGVGFICETPRCRKPATWVSKDRGGARDVWWICEKCYRALGPSILELKEVLPRPEALKIVLPDGVNERRLYKLSRPIHPAAGAKCTQCGHECEPRVEYIVVSAAKRAFVHETMIFEGDADGNILNWLDYPGTVKGDMDFDLAIAQFLEHFNG